MPRRRGAGGRKFTAAQERASHRQNNIKHGQLRRPASPVAPDAPFTAEELDAVHSAVGRLPPINVDGEEDHPPPRKRTAPDEAPPRPSKRIRRQASDAQAGTKHQTGDYDHSDHDDDDDGDVDMGDEKNADGYVDMMRDDDRARLTTSERARVRLALSGHRPSSSKKERRPHANEAAERAMLGLDDEEMEPKYDALAALIASVDVDAEAHDAQVQSLGGSQREAYRRIVEMHESIFVTGGAGKGKTHLLRSVIQGLRQSGRTVAVLAPTGVAAHHIRGATLHSFLHLPPKWYGRTLSGVIAALRKKPDKLVRFQLVETVVIDEISMVPAKLFHWMNKIMQAANNTTLPFGGRQLIVCGDFYQLPPVSEPNPAANTNPGQTPSVEEKRKARDEEVAPFCFETAEWRTMFPPSRCIELVENFRQKDPRFIQLLNRARVGALSDADLVLLRQVWTATRSRLAPTNRSRPAAVDAVRAMGEFRVRLFGLCAKVEHHNENAEQAIRTRDRDRSRTFHTSKHLRPWTEKQVAHIDQLRGWFDKHRRTLTREKRLYHVEHLSQFDVTREEAEEKLMDELPVPKQVRLSIGSRVMLVKNWKTEEGLVHGRTGWVTGFGDEGPIIAFDGDKPEDPPLEIEVPPSPWTAICADGRLVATQVPLTFAWGITVHKSQGLSMPRADMDLGHLFAPGQGYVALSRLTSLDGLGLIDFDPTRVFADPRVTDFYQRLSGGPVPKRPHFFVDDSLLPKDAPRQPTPSISTQPPPTPSMAPLPPQSTQPPPTPSRVPLPPPSRDPPPTPTPPAPRKEDGAGPAIGQVLGPKSGQDSVVPPVVRAAVNQVARFCTNEERAATESLLLAEFGEAFVQRLRDRAVALGIAPPSPVPDSPVPSPAAAPAPPSPNPISPRSAPGTAPDPPSPSPVSPRPAPGPLSPSPASPRPAPRPDRSSPRRGPAPPSPKPVSPRPTHPSPDPVSPRPAPGVAGSPPRRGPAPPSFSPGPGAAHSSPRFGPAPHSPDPASAESGAARYSPRPGGASDCGLPFSRLAPVSQGVGAGPFAASKVRVDTARVFRPFRPRPLLGVIRDIERTRPRPEEADERRAAPDASDCKSR